MLSIVVPAYRPASLLKQCVERIDATTDLSDAEVIVVCNGSDRESADAVLSMGAAFRLVWLKDAVGFTRAANIGLRLSCGDRVVLMNTDAWLLPQNRNEWVERMAAPMRNPSVGITGVCRYEGPYGDFLPFFFTMIRREVIDAVGYLDEAFSPGYDEDYDYCIRARLAGYGVATVENIHAVEDGKTVTDFPIYHPGEGSFTDRSAREELLRRNHGILNRKWGNGESTNRSIWRAWLR